MIDKKDLRIGNIVKTDNSDVVEIIELRENNARVKQYDGHISFIDYERLFGEELTEEWLLKFAFIKDKYQADECGEDVGDLYVLNNFMICKKEGVFYNYIEIEGDRFYSFCSTKLTHVHQLQNLYLALKEEELKLKVYKINNTKEHLQSINIYDDEEIINWEGVFIQKIGDSIYDLEVYKKLIYGNGKFSIIKTKQMVLEKNLTLKN